MNEDNPFNDAERKTLIESSIYRGLSDEQMDLILDACQLQQHAPDETIVRAGEIGSGLYVIIEGQVKVFLPQTMPDGSGQQISKVSLATLKPGTCFGEYSLLDQKEVSATVEAVSPARICYLANSDYRRIVDTDLAVENIIYRNLLNLLVGRLRAINLELDSVFLA